MVGRLAGQKDPGMMLALVRELSPGAQPIDAVWIGGGDDEWTRRLTQAGIRVTGWLSKDEVTRELDELSVYVHTSAYEGFPLSVLDAAARAVPVVARSIPALDEAGLPTFDGARAGADLIRQILDDRSSAADAAERAAAMLSRMNASTQREALETVWRG